jgi:CRISPR system Cascade subunit CasA
MSLLTEPWMPVRTRAGERRWISPEQLSDPEVLAFDADRADFNGALAQFAIGLLATFVPVQDTFAWRALFKTPPPRTDLHTWFQPGVDAFVYDGDGARFMQDRVLGESGDVGVAALLVDSPGENTIKNNSDHFVKRGRVERLCPHCAVIALLTLQINAPAGGAGHRTGLRGGGPLTTLLACQPPKSLWHDLWLNVIEPPHHHDHGGDAKKVDGHFTFPWLADITAIQPDKGETAPKQTHPLHIFWAMPRRIRLDFQSTSSGTCDLCHRASDRLLSQYSTKAYGLNYKGPWDHVLSPYYQTKEGWLPLHPQLGGFGYRHWLPWVLGSGDDKQRQRPARVVERHALSRRQSTVGGQFQIWAFGFDMENMKARCWYEARLPLYNLDDCAPSDLRRLEVVISRWLEGARFARYALSSAVKSAWFKLDARGDFSLVDARFWAQTEEAFYRNLREVIDEVRGSAVQDHEALGERWLQTLSQVCRDLFDKEFVGAGLIDRQNPRRVADAHKLLLNTLNGSKLRQLLALPTLDVGKPAKARPAKVAKTKNKEEA